MLSNLSASPLIFALDTSSKMTSMAITEGERRLAGFEATVDDRRSERLWTQARFLLGEAGRSIDEVELFAVCVGPGGFTGIRVGVAAAKGLAMPLGRPLIGVTSLEAAALAAGPAPSVFVAIKAYRGEVYHQLFSVEPDRAPVALRLPAAELPGIAAESLASVGHLVLAGTAAGDIAQSLDGGPGGAGMRLGGNLIVKPVSRLGAYDVARAALLKLRAGESGRPEEVRACYVRPSEAEVKLSLGLLGKKEAV